MRRNGSRDSDGVGGGVDWNLGSCHGAGGDGAGGDSVGGGDVCGGGYVGEGTDGGVERDGLGGVGRVVFPWAVDAFWAFGYGVDD